MKGKKKAKERGGKEGQGKKGLGIHKGKGSVQTANDSQEKKEIKSLRCRVDTIGYVKTLGLERETRQENLKQSQKTWEMGFGGKPYVVFLFRSRQLLNRKNGKGDFSLSHERSQVI